MPARSAPITVERARGLRAERQAAARRRGAAHGRPHAARSRVRLPASGHGGRRAGRGRLVAVEPADLWRRRCAGRAGRRRTRNALPPFSTVIFHCGGTGARPGKDGLDVTAFPSGVRTIPVEATESVAPVMFRRREFREGSGGAGQLPRRARPGHRTRRRRRHADRDAVQFRAHQQPGARPRRRRRRRAGPGRRCAPASRSGRRAGRACPAAISSGSNCRAAAASATRPSATPSRSPPMSPTGSYSRETAERDYRVALTADGAVDCERTARMRG